MREQGCQIREIAEHFNCGIEAISHVLRRDRVRVRDRKNEAAKKIGRVVKHSISIPANVLEERDRRLNAEMTLSMAMFGDPVVRRWDSNA